jgi:hypothetical protein
VLAGDSMFKVIAFLSRIIGKTFDPQEKRRPCRRLQNSGT